jgi:hypothetical protein
MTDTPSSPSEPLTAIERIRRKLVRHPSIRFTIDGGTVNVHPSSEDGFNVWLSENNSSYTVAFDGWHEEFTDMEEALATFAFGMSEDCRLKVVMRGSTECSWTVEGLEDGNWEGDSTTGLVLVPFWRKRRTLYRRNHHFPTGGTESTDSTGAAP